MDGAVSGAQTAALQGKAPSGRKQRFAAADFRVAAAQAYLNKKAFTWLKMLLALIAAQVLLFPAFLGYDRKPELDFEFVIVYIRGAILRNLFLVQGPLHFELDIPEVFF